MNEVKQQTKQQKVIRLWKHFYDREPGMLKIGDITKLSLLTAITRFRKLML